MRGSPLRNVGTGCDPHTCTCPLPSHCPGPRDGLCRPGCCGQTLALGAGLWVALAQGHRQEGQQLLWSPNHPPPPSSPGASPSAEFLSGSRVRPGGRSAGGVLLSRIMSPKSVLLPQPLQDSPGDSPGSLPAGQSTQACPPPPGTQAQPGALRFGDSPTSHLRFTLPPELLKPRYVSLSCPDASSEPAL